MSRRDREFDSELLDELLDDDSWAGGCFLVGLTFFVSSEDYLEDYLELPSSLLLLLLPLSERHLASFSVLRASGVLSATLAMDSCKTGDKRNNNLL